MDGSHSVTTPGVYDKNQFGLTINFGSQSRSVTVKPHGLRFTYYANEMQVGRIEVELEKSMQAATEYELSYDLVPTP